MRVVADQVCTPTAAADLAEMVGSLVATGRHGLYHLTNGGSCSWYEFARAAFRLAGVDVEPAPIPSREYGAAARRPAYSVLANAAAAAAGLPPLRPWPEALTAYLRERGVFRGGNL